MLRLSRTLLVIFLIVLAGSFAAYRAGYLDLRLPSASPPSAKSAAPEFVGIERWLNGGPLKMADLRGRVVLVDFWTYSCVNCRRTLPYIKSWHEKYRGKGLVVVGVHSPEFAFEKDPENVAQAIKRYRVTWPVALDNEMRTWTAYDNHYWPHKYLVDRKGVIRYDHIGEGAYNETERMIQKLLSEGGPAVSGELTKERPVPISRSQSAELYAGYARGLIGNEGGYVRDRAAAYRDPGDPFEDRIYAQGLWLASAESFKHARSTDDLRDYVVMRYSAKDVYVVTAGKGEAPYHIYVTLDGRSLDFTTAGSDVRFDARGSYVQADLSTLYHVISTKAFGAHTLKLSSDSDAFALFAFTFGS